MFPPTRQNTYTPCLPRFEVSLERKKPDLDRRNQQGNSNSGIKLYREWHNSFVPHPIEISLTGLIRREQVNLLNLQVVGLRNRFGTESKILLVSEQR